MGYALKKEHQGRQINQFYLFSSFKAALLLGTLRKNNFKNISGL